MYPALHKLAAAVAGATVFIALSATTGTVLAAPTLATSATPATLTPQPGGAQPDNTEACPSSSLCMWENAGWNGVIWIFSISNNPQNEWLYVGSVPNDKTSSIYNDRVHDAFVAENANPNKDGGGIACLIPKEAYQNLAEWHWAINDHNANDSISAFALLSEATSCEYDATFEGGG